MRVADTSCLYAAYDADDVFHARAREALADMEAIRVPSEIFSETIALLQMRLGFTAALAAGNHLRSLPHVKLEGATPAVVAQAWVDYHGAGGKLSLPDSLVVAWCKTKGATPLSFDKEILKRA